MGIQQLKEVVKVGLDIGKALSDGIGIEDVTALLGLPAAIEGITDVPAEIADLDDEEKEELKQFVQDNFDLPDDDLEAFIESAISVVVDMYGLFLKFQALSDEEPN